MREVSDEGKLAIWQPMHSIDEQTVERSVDIHGCPIDKERINLHS